jgi:peptidoglycan/xylan/chitin deacetylase (PgdA/CDA1 family)
MARPRGIFVLSLDTEIAWGSFDEGGLRRYARHFDQERTVVKRLLTLLDRYQIPATWAFVGHLLLDRCSKLPDGTTHPDVLRPRYDWYSYDWHHCDPGTNVQSDPWWYAPDMVEMVLQAAVDHEIGTHTFSHIVADDPACTPEIFRSQIEACIVLHRALGLSIDSIVYPRNKVAFLDLLADLGIMVYRGKEQRWYTRLHPRLIKLFHMLDRTVPFVPTTYPLANLTEQRLVNIPASMFLLARDGFRRMIPIGSRVHQAKRGLFRAAAQGELFHLWFHPFNLASDMRLFDGLEEIFRCAAALRDQGRLATLTMRNTAELVREMSA